MSIETGVASRLRKIQGSHSAAEFARKCGVGESLWRKYLAGSTPGVDRAAQIAAAAGVSLRWLATGDGPMVLPASTNEDAGPYAVEKAAGIADLEALPLDPLALRQAVQIVLETLEGAAPGHSYGRAANLITICYQALTSGMRPEMMRELLEGVRCDPGKST